MKKLIVILLAGCTFVISQDFRNVAAADGGTPLRQLAGTYAVTIQGSEFSCSAACDSPGATGSPITILGIGSLTFDTQGNACATFTVTVADSPADASPPFVGVFSAVSKITNYDPRTGTGDKTGTGYSGGQCHGATFDSTGATVTGTSIERIAVSNHGKRIDSIVTSLGGDPTTGGFTQSVTLLRQ